ncbi:MAG: family efflux transporter subunit, HlyD family secretion protein [Parcubacteria group bacterium]|nr:family efflux transporter subunit, HlyD family secretion protein [Parcubacteria group bacterium]
MTHLKKMILAHKALSGLVAVALLSAAYGSFHSTSASTEMRYVLGTVDRSTVVSSVSGTGTVSATNQIDVKAKTSGDALSVRVKAGDTVGAGQTLVTLDARDASIALEDAQISYQKLTEPADNSALSSAQSALVNAETSETAAYNSAVTDISSLFLDVPSILDGLDDLFGTSSGYISDANVRYVSDVAITDRSGALSELNSVEGEFTNLTSEYRTLSRTSSTTTVQTLLSHAYMVTKDLAQTLKDTKTTVDYVKANTPPQNAALGATAQANVSTWTDKNTSHLSALLSDESSMTTTHLSVADKQAALVKVNQGADPLDLESAQLGLQQKEQAVSDSVVRAPFSGVVAKVDVKVGDSVSGGTTVATLITPDEVAEVSLNEVDAAKVKIGDKATLTFDAVDGLSISGVVSEIDLIGTVSQGVVTYSTKITFDTQDTRVRPGMSVSAEIITDSKIDVLAVPSAAVKIQNGVSYVQVFDPALNAAGGTQGVASLVPPTQVEVGTGVIGDTLTEILSGLTEGEQIVTRTVSPSATTAATAQTGSLFGGGAARGGATGSATRALGR